MADVKTNLLLGAGVLALSQSLTLWDLTMWPVARAAGAVVLAEDDEAGGGGEGGEAGGEGGVALPESYALNSTDPNKWNYDAKAVITAYVDGAYTQYTLAAAAAGKLDDAIGRLLDEPSQATLDEARAAWVAARPAYLVTEAYRFYDGPIEEVEGRLNSWPMNEAAIDYTRDDPRSGIVNDPKISADAATLTALNQKSDEKDVTTGWHAIEFLLWGQDLSATGPGNRPYTDYEPGETANDKRRAYLKAVTDLLLSDLKSLVAAWDRSDPRSYATKFEALAPREAVGRMINGIAVMAGSELRSERMAVALDSGDQEDEQSCFSDTTNQDIDYDLIGVQNVYYGQYPGGPKAGLNTLMTALDPERAKAIDAAMSKAAAATGALPRPWDSVLAAAPGSAERREAEAAVAALGELAAELKKAGSPLGVLIQIPGM